ncbi:MAG: sulfate ABC transporter permease subunit CysT [Planctomycetota bacterium]|nr:MAG: sulfate ABC transporter permease subunit CysT [Planctomycetota bacterium]
MFRRTASTSARALPGFGLTLGYTVLYLSLIVLLPLSALLLRAGGLGWDQFWETVTHPRVVASYRLTFGTSLAAATINAVFGLVVAWTLVRLRFPGRRLLDALIDLPFAMPTAVSGIALAAVYSPHGWLGQVLEPLGVKVVYTPIGIMLALTLIGLPFVVRTLQPAIADLERETEEAAASLGASRWQTHRRVIFPSILPALMTGFALALARAIGEYGSVIFVSSNLPMKTEIASLLIVSKLDQYDVGGATAIAVMMLFISFGMLLVINGLQRLASRRYREAL